jgi:hypothetical protein
VRIFGSFQMTAGRVVTPEDVNSMFSHLFELAAASDSLGSKQSFAAVDPNVCFADYPGVRLTKLDVWSGSKLALG